MGCQPQELRMSCLIDLEGHSLRFLNETCSALSGLVSLVFTLPETVHGFLIFKDFWENVSPVTYSPSVSSADNPLIILSKFTLIFKHPLKSMIHLVQRVHVLWKFSIQNPHALFLRKFFPKSNYILPGISLRTLSFAGPYSL